MTRGRATRDRLGARRRSDAVFYRHELRAKHLGQHRKRGATPAPTVRQARENSRTAHQAVAGWGACLARRRPVHRATIRSLRTTAPYMSVVNSVYATKAPQSGKRASNGPLK